MQRLEDRTVPSTVQASFLAYDPSQAAGFTCHCAMCSGVTATNSRDDAVSDNYVFSNGSSNSSGASKWSQPSGLGSQITITYSFHSSVTSGLSGVSYAQIRAAVQEALAEWAQYAPLNFVEVADSGPNFTTGSNYTASSYPKIRIGAAAQDGQYGVLAYAYYPSSSGLGGDVVLDSNETWGTSPGSGRIDLIEVVEHELGHTLGLGHEPTNTAIMNPYYGSRFNGPGTAFLYQDDINGIRALYGTGTGSVTPLGGGGSGSGSGGSGGTPTFTISGSTLTVTGTSGDDSFLFQAGSSQHTVTANGVTRNYSNTTITKIIFLGQGGQDSVTAYGSAGNEILSLDATQLVMTGTRINLQAVGFESVIVNGNGGSDTATLADTASTDQVGMSSAQTTLQGGGQSWQVNSFRNVSVASTHGGSDAVYFYGSAGNDTFAARSGYASVSGSGYQAAAAGFAYAQAVTGNGGNDVSYLYDSAGNDVLRYYNGLTWLSTADGYTLSSYLFGPVYTYSQSGGYDAAYLYGTAAADSFTASPYAASMSTPGGLAYALGFDYVLGLGNGGSDVSALYDSTGNDVIYDSAGFTSIQAAGVQYQAYGFATTYVVSQGGSDQAALYDTAGDDLFVQIGTDATFARAGGWVTNLYGVEIGSVVASGGTDVAYLYGTAGNDIFYASGGSGTLAASDAVWSLSGFDAVGLQNWTGFDIVSALSATTFTLYKGSNWA